MGDLKRPWFRNLALLGLLSGCGEASNGTVQADGGAPNLSPQGSESPGPSALPTPPDGSDPDTPESTPSAAPSPAEPGSSTEPASSTDPVPAASEEEESPNAPETNPYSVDFECVAGTPPAPNSLLRLSLLQYRNTLQDLFASYDLGPLVDALDTSFAQFPADGTAESSFKNLDARVSQRHIDGFYAVASNLAAASTDTAEVLTQLAGACAETEPVDAACFQSFVESLGSRVYRRPLSSEEVTRLLELNDPALPSREVYRSAVFSLLMAPQFLYSLELNGEPVASDENHLRLAAHELAARLAYHFWQTMPDAELTQAAEDGSLLSDAGYEAQVERLFQDPRAESSAFNFFSDWYRLDIFGGFASTPAFETFANGVSANTSLYDAAVDEIHALVNYQLNNGGNYADILLSDQIFTQSSELAALYGAMPYAGSGEPARFASGERAGLLTRAAMLISANHETNPFRRGAFVLRELLCTPVAPPAGLPAGALVPPPFDPMASTRERFEAKVAPAECYSCHSTFTPYGLALEAYDGLGRLRTEERLIDDDGSERGTVPVDTQVMAYIDTAELQSLDGPLALSQALADSVRAKECFARHYFRYTYRRFEQPGDECALTTTLQRVSAGGSLRSALRDVALDPAFKERVIGPVEQP